MNPAYRFLIVHGALGSSQSNWFPWLKSELEKKGHKVFTPDFPTPENQNLQAWREVFYRELGQLTKKDILIGHSVGVAFLLKILQELSQPIAGCFLLAGFISKVNLEPYDTVNKTFIAPPFNWEKIKKTGGMMHIYAGDNDPYVPLDKTEIIAKNLQLDLKIIPGGEHLNQESGHTSIPFLYDDIIAMVANAH